MHIGNPLYLAICISYTDFNSCHGILNQYAETLLHGQIFKFDSLITGASTWLTPTEENAVVTTSSAATSWDYLFCFFIIIMLCLGVNVDMWIFPRHPISQRH